MTKDSQIISLNQFLDERGIIRFANSFDMCEIVRFYEISPSNQEYIRAWQAHEFERKWFYCLNGSFVINLVEIDDFNHPSEKLIPKKVQLKFDQPSILPIPQGFATGIRATSDKSRLLIFSNASLETSKSDDYRYPTNQWNANWE